jgi:hypothetical protein
MQAFLVHNKRMTFAAVIWAANARLAGSLAFELGAHPLSRIRVMQIDGHAKSF